jgi:hypothetical protein
MLPGKKMSAARRECEDFLANLRAQSRASAGGRSVIKDHFYVLPESVIEVLVWNEVASLGLEEDRPWVRWADAPDATPSPPPTPRPTPTPDVMATYWDDPDLSFRWLDSGEYQCSYGNVCKGMIWQTTKPCDNLWVELEFLDKDGVVVDRDIESASLTAGQSAKLIFETLKKAGTRLLIHDVTCYTP